MSVDALDPVFVAEHETGAFVRAGVLRRLARDRVAAAAALTLTAILLAALLAPWIAPYDPYFTDLTKVMQPPGAEHWFGTDNTGRDPVAREAPQQAGTGECAGFGLGDKDGFEGLNAHRRATLGSR